MLAQGGVVSSSRSLVDWGAASLFDTEAHLYPHVENYLNSVFYAGIKPSLGSLFLTSEITARAAQGPQGAWTRPDLCAVAVWQRKYSAIRNVDLYGFEVKRARPCDVSAVHEALAHSRFVHFSYLVWNWSTENLTAQNFVAVEESCRGLGVGLIIAHDPARVDRYQLRVAATRKDPDADVVDHFIEEKFSEAKRKLIADSISKQG